MWTKEKPITSGYYFFYGDPFWDQLPHDEAHGINPFKPERYIVKVQYIRENFIVYIVDGTYSYESKGVWWDIPIEFPKID
jgi:hypothetical protein